MVVPANGSIGDLSRTGFERTGEPGRGGVARVAAGRAHGAEDRGGVEGVREPIDLEEDPNHSENTNSLTLVGKIISDKPLNKTGVKNILLKAWNTHGGLKIQEQEGRLLFSFTCEKEYQKVLQSRPWTVMGSHLVIKEWPQDVALHEVKLSSSPFWIRVCGLPPNRMTKNNATTIGNKIGEL
ncbi:hypothetical protein RJ639_010317 [Escallonia herrerae]|uniref:DUF4283 domain-containing protein n=1 Tax=Escallonia herrerae TaxID=1293975 RepID=A0AA89AT80_9ASTE|nr:hypothetical protein RJ639_010317 [Escallonia herrerae]